MTDTSPTGPLAGVRVFDLSRVLAGPSATQILGDLGADVIKVEQPGKGDDTRAWGPPYLQDAEGRDTGESAYYLSANRNKRSITLDIQTAEGQALAKRLIAGCDVLIENFKVGGLAKYGLGHEQLLKEFPGLVYCSLTGFGQTGPYAAMAGYDYMIQAMGGIMGLTGEPEGQPMKVGVAIADLMAGMYAAVAILAALRHKERTGQGQHIDLALLDAQVAWLANQGQYYLTSGRVPPRVGNAHPTIVPYQVFATSDGHVVLAVGNDGQYRKFCDHVGRPDLAADPRFATNPARVRHRTELVPLLEAILATRTTRDWVDGLAPLGVPCGPINRMDEVFADPQVVQREMKVAVPHPAAPDPIALIGSPLKLSATPVSYRRPPPTLGQHTQEVLSELLGLDADAVADLRRRGVV